MINNTFYDNDGALRIGDIYKGELVMLNNLIFANGAGIFGDPSYTVANLRTPIEGYNNIIVGAEQGVNDAIDDECFNSGKAQYNNTVETWLPTRCRMWLCLPYCLPTTSYPTWR